MVLDNSSSGKGGGDVCFCELFWSHSDAVSREQAGKMQDLCRARCFRSFMKTGSKTLIIHTITSLPGGSSSPKNDSEDVISGNLLER